MHSVANLATFTDPLTASQKAPSDKSLRVCLNLILFLRVAGTAVRARGLAVPARTHTPFSLSLSLSLYASELFSERRRGAALSVKHRYYVASLILHACIPEITAQLLSLSYVYLILPDDGSNIRIFVQINIYEGRTGYVA